MKKLRWLLLGLYLAAVLLLLEEFLIPLTEHWQLVLGPILVVIVLFARRGLAGIASGFGRGGHER